MQFGCAWQNIGSDTNQYPLAVSPFAPSRPLIPADPVAPLSPGGPGYPEKPGIPVVPFSPSGPGGPIEPLGPTLPCKCKSYSLNLQFIYYLHLKELPKCSQSHLQGGILLQPKLYLYLNANVDHFPATPVQHSDTSPFSSNPRGIHKYVARFDN